jgi:hypothetical protein
VINVCDDAKVTYVFHRRGKFQGQVLQCNSVGLRSQKLLKLNGLRHICGECLR